jgi:hypothetical protein
VFRSRACSGDTTSPNKHTGLKPVGAPETTTANWTFVCNTFTLLHLLRLSAPQGTSSCSSKRILQGVSSYWMQLIKAMPFKVFLSNCGRRNSNNDDQAQRLE